MTNLNLKVVEITTLTPKIKSFRLESADGTPLPDWSAGAHLVFDLDGLARSYSLAGDPGDNNSYLTAILREDAGDGGGRYVDGLLDDGMDTFAGLLSNQRTLIYLCGLDGMRIGLFRTLAAHGLDSGYLRIDPALAGGSPGDWSAADIKKGIKPTGRCLIEVY